MSRPGMTIAAAATLFTALFAAAQPKPCRVGFTSPMIHDRGLAPRVAVAEGDFDRDGRTDLISLHRFGDDGFAGRIGTVLLNRGSDAFDPIPLVAGQGDFSTIHVADLNRDANLDAIAGGFFSTVIFLGNGNGTFRKSAELPVRSVAAVTAGDFNGDNRVDLAFVHINPGALSVHLANADGTYSQASTASLPAEGRAIAAADFDDDGRIDLVVADRINATPYFNDGGATFTRGNSFQASAPPLSLAVADITGDRILDIVVGGQSGISAFAGNGNRTFRLNGNYGLASDAQSVTLADLNRDGQLDMVVAGGGDVVTFRGNGGFFTQTGVYAGGAGATWATVAELTGDSLPDIAAANTGSADVAILRNMGNVRFDAMEKYFTSNRTTMVMSVDLNADTFPDLLAYSDEFPEISVLYGRESGGLAAGGGSRLAWPARWMRVGDFNGDGLRDIAAMSEDGIRIAALAANATGGFSGLGEFLLPEPAASFEVNDLNSDGRADLIVFDRDGEIDVYPALSGGGFGATILTVMAHDGVSITTAADFTGDQILDYVAAGNGSITLVRGSAGGLVVGAPSFGPGNIEHLVAANLNGDQILDLGIGTPNGVDVYLATPAGGFTGHYGVSLAAKAATGLAAADLDGDGDIDLAATSVDLSTSGNYVAALFNRGDGSLELGVSATTESQPRTLAAGDFDNDGFIDLAFAAGKVIVARGQCEVQRASLFATPNPAVAGQPITLVANALGGGANGIVFTFRRGDTVIGGANPLPHEPGVGRFTIGALPQGVHQVTAIAFYPEGSSAESDPITIVVGAPRRRSVRN